MSDVPEIMSGIERLQDPDTGSLGRRVPLGSRPVFVDVEVKAGQLCYHPLGEMTRAKADDEEKILEDFLALRDAPDNEIEAYARRRGVLGLCAHGVPVGHESLRTRLAWLVALKEQWRKPVYTPFDRLLLERHRHAPVGLDAPCFPVAPARWTTATVVSEPLELWRIYAQLAGRLLKVAAEGTHNRDTLAETLDHWLSLTPLRPCCALERGRLTLKFRSIHPLSGLFSVLGFQTFLAASAARSLLVCSSCGRPYMPRSVPRTGKHTYCRRCGINAAWRAASRRYYQNRKERRVDNGTQTQRE